MHSDPIVFTIFLIFSGAALVATLALYARQSLLVVYIALGILLDTRALAKPLGEFPATMRESSLSAQRGGSGRLYNLLLPLG